MIRSYKYRLYPNKTQADKLHWTLARCCELYNAALQERKEAWKYERKSISRYDQQNDLPDIKQSIRPEYNDIGAHVLQDVIHRVDKTFKSMFVRVKRGEKAGFPRFKSSRRYDSFTYPDMGGLSVKGNKVILPKIGACNVVLHRPLEGKCKTCTVAREGDAWYVVFACEVEQIQRSPYTDDAVGIDLGLLHFATLSTGDTIENPRYYRKSEKKLEVAQQALSRKKRGSNRRRKAVKRVSKAYRKVRNQRKDFLHKESRKLVDTYEVLVFEDLTPSNMSRRPKPKQDEATGQYLPNGASAKGGLNKSILDAGWSDFVSMCQRKAEDAGVVQVITVNPQYTSQVCSQCGTVKKKTLDERWHSCECGAELDRDHNAAINILNKHIRAGTQPTFARA